MEIICFSFLIDGKKLNSSGNKVHSLNDWKVSILTGSAGTSAGVSLWVYGSKGSTGPIILGAGKKGQLFKARQEDEFMVITISITNKM